MTPAPYLLCATPRTGSTRLCRLLASTGVAGRPESYFREPDRDRWSATLGVAAADDTAFGVAVRRHTTTPNGVSGARVMWGSWGPAVDAFGAAHLVHVVRPDRVAQAVSWARAEQTGHWQDGDRTSYEPVLDLDQVDRLVRTIGEHDAAWRRWFTALEVEPLVVTYDDVVDRPREVVERVLALVGVEVPAQWEPVSQTQRQADHVNADWIAAYRARHQG